jgi:hypothetical protein
MAILTNPAKEKSKPLALQNAPSNFHIPDLFRTSQVPAPSTDTAKEEGQWKARKLEGKKTPGPRYR